MTDFEFDGNSGFPVDGTSGFPTEAKSTIVLWDGFTYNSIYVTLTFNGEIRFFVCSDGDTETWEEITGLTSGVKTTYSFITPGIQIKWRAIMAVDSYISKIIIEKVT